MRTGRRTGPVTAALLVRTKSPSLKCTDPLRFSRTESAAMSHAESGALTMTVPESSKTAAQLVPVHSRMTPVFVSKHVSPGTGLGLRVVDVHGLVRVPTYSSARVTLTDEAPARIVTFARGIS